MSRASKLHVSRPASRRSRAYHRSLRGSAFIEALAVMLLFSSLFGCAAMFGQSYAARILSGQRARAAAWRQTAEGCDERQRNLLQAADAMADAPDPRHAQALLRALDQTLPRSEPEPSTGTWSGLLPWDSSKRPATLRTQTLFSCNELPVTSARHALPEQRLAAQVSR
jgi:hypothetical protein